MGSTIDEAADVRPTPAGTLDRGPGLAIMAGFSLVAADNPVLGQTLRTAARRASEEFTAVIEGTPRDTPEGQYLRELLMAAVSFAAGLTRRQQERAQRIQTAEHERNFNFKRIAQTQKWGGMLKAGIQLLALGGFAYALVGAIFSSRWLQGRTQGMHREYSAMATALAFALIGGFLKSWYTSWRMDQVDKKYKRDMLEAKTIYLREATQEYEYAAQEASLAWQRYTGRSPPVTDAFRVLILGLLTGEQQMEGERERRGDTETQGHGDAGTEGQRDGGTWGPRD